MFYYEYVSLVTHLYMRLDEHSYESFVSFNTPLLKPSGSSSQNLHDMDNSPLQKLPREIRDHNYDIALHVYGGVRICDGDNGQGLDTPLQNTKVLALTAMCKQISSESLPVFYVTKHFVFATGILIGMYWMSYLNPLGNFSAWIDETGQDNHSSVRHVNIGCGWTDTGNFGATGWVIANIAEPLREAIKYQRSKTTR